MSGKKHNSLRNALRGMRVNEPMRLSNNGPSFRPPVRNEPAQFEAPQTEPPRSETGQVQQAGPERPHLEPTQAEATRQEMPQNEVDQFEQVPHELPQKEVTQTEALQIEGAEIEVPQNEGAENKVAHSESALAEAPRIGGLTQKEVAQNGRAQAEVASLEQPTSESTQSERVQSEAPQFEPPQMEHPPISRRRDAGGFFRLSDRVFSYPQLQRLSGDCFRLFLWMSSRAWRFTRSDGSLRASIGFIETHTGMSHATVSRGLRTLRETDLIDLVEIDYKRGNLWSVSPIAFAGCGPDDIPPRAEAPQNEIPRNEGGAPSKGARRSLKLRGKTPQNEGDLRSIKKIRKLSQEALVKLLAPIEALGATQKRKSESEFLESLLERFSEQDVLLMASYIGSRGVLKTGERCHSLYRYLATAADDVLACARKAQSLLPATDTNSGSNNAAPDLEERKAAVQCFETELPAAIQERMVKEYSDREYPHGFLPPPSVVKSLVAMQWLKARNSGLDSRIAS